jgi:SAM-dependent methyltransferase
MSYICYTYRDQSQRDLEMWDNRDIDTETRIIDYRSIVPVFDRYLVNGYKLIEAGCGIGGWVRYFSLKGFDITGVEYDERIVKQAKSFDHGINIMHNDVSQLDFPDNTFDGYISLGVIEHFQNGPYEALAEAKRVIKPDGLMFVSVPLLTLSRRLFAHPLRSLYFFLHVLRGRKKYFGEYRYTKRELLNFLNEFSFEPLYIGVDDYLSNDTRHHIGLYTDYPFLRKAKGEMWELNLPGKSIRKALCLVNQWFACSGIIVVARNVKN